MAQPQQHEKDIANANHDDAGSPDLDKAVTKEYATGIKLVAVMLSICLNTALVGLELGIISTAIPGITDAFHRIQDVGWYGCATFLLVGSCASLWGKAYKYFNIKYAYLVSICLLIIGSIVSAAAPNSTAVIVGRAIQGTGIGGSLSGSVILINLLSHPKLHPMLIGLWTADFMIATILGPIIGGAFTTGVTWRWCFWINLPLGGPVIVLVLLFLHMPKHAKPSPASAKEILLHLDFPGFTFLLASLVCLALALQRGGQTSSWSDGSTIATLVLWIVFTIIFVAIEYFQGGKAIVPLRLLRPRLTWTNSLYTFFCNAANYQIIFYMPIYLQAVRGDSAIMSGVHLLPFLAFFAFGAMVSGALAGKTRHLQPFELASALLTTAGTALLYTLEVDSSLARYVGPQVLAGFGLGLGNQVPMTAVQGLSKPEDMTSSSGIILMMQALSGAYFILIAQSIWANRLIHDINTHHPGISAQQVIATGSGADQIRSSFQGADLTAVLDAYMVGIKDVFAFSLAAAALTVIIAIIIPFQRLPDHNAAKATEQSAEAKDDSNEV
ncbi:MFS Mycotoxin efflux transport protein (either gliotoxin or aflatoxin) [Teratosphaeria destructans]|uniref:MFS Mycotoxin efflux transport protein (Either gliotoxin or aflatoxin) n=1 Tax=Teratosphaeria destructans TaxID=418781 RepID=A0A9W7SZN0_9PEZI|nr:MFS Mycotoxin efflux transport protein (either gliotoxin or aflatoxin) [Teratosphaeria destructans]